MSDELERWIDWTMSSVEWHGRRNEDDVLSGEGGMYGGAGWDWKNDAGLGFDETLEREDDDETRCEVCGEPGELYVYRTTSGAEYARDRCAQHDK